VRNKGPGYIRQKSKEGKYTLATLLVTVGITTYIDSSHAIPHIKIMVIDQEMVINGSFNFIRAAEEKNAENLLIIKSKELAKPYIENWNPNKGHSKPYQARY
jgi:Phosphatidylserine/phosphatidylglycerophosphate/cardiolipin synthases and related enzymes